MLNTLLRISAMIFFFFNDTATTEIYTLSLHDALPIFRGADPPRLHRPAARGHRRAERAPRDAEGRGRGGAPAEGARSEEHTSELQSQSNLVCRLLLEKKKRQSSPPVLQRAGCRSVAVS